MKAKKDIFEGSWVDELPKGFWKITIDIISGARYYRIYQYSKYTGAALFARGYYRCPNWTLPWLEKWCPERRIYKKEAFNPRKVIDEYIHYSIGMKHE